MDFVIWLMRSPFTYLWGHWSKYLTLLTTVLIFAGLLGLTVDSKAVYVSVISAITFLLLLGISFIRSIYELYRSREDLQGLVKPKIRLEAEPIRRERTVMGEPINMIAAVKVTNVSRTTSISNCTGEIVEFDQILEDGRFLRNIGQKEPCDKSSQGSNLLEDSFSPVIIRWSNLDSDGTNISRYRHIQSVASLDIAFIDGAGPSFLTLATLNADLRGQFSYVYNLPNQYYRLVVEVTADNTAPVKQAFKLTFSPRTLIKSGTKDAELNLVGIDD